MTWGYPFRELGHALFDAQIDAKAAPSGGRAPIATDPDGAAVVWVNVATGEVRAAGDAQADETLTRGGWIAGFVDAGGRVIAGVHRDAGFCRGVIPSPMPSVKSVTDGSTTRAQAYVADGSASRRLSIFESAVESVERAAPGIIAAGCADGSLRFANFKGTGNAASTDTVLRVIIYLGQSLAAGGVNSGATAYLDQPLSDMAGKIKMLATTLNGGAGYGILAHGISATAMVQADFTGFANAAEQVLHASYGELGMLNAAWMLNGPAGRAYGSNYLVVSFAKGNTAYSGLKQGTQPYTNLIEAMTKLPTLATAAGYTSISIEGIIWDQGENNDTDSEATYIGHLEELYADLTADLHTALSSSATYQMYVLQKGIFKSGDLIGPAKAQLSINATNSQIICCGPQYMAAFGDHYHPTSNEHRFLAAYRAKAIQRFRELGTAPPPLRLASWTMVGECEAELTFSGNVGKVVLDGSFVTDPGTAGLSYVDDTSTTSIIRVGETSEDNKLWVEFRAKPTGANPYIRTGWIASGDSSTQGRTAGNRTIIRDSDISAVCPATGRILYNFACHERVARS